MWSLWFIFSLACSKGVIGLHYSGVLPYEKALEECSKRGSKLLLPVNNSTNVDLSNYLNHNQITSTWIEAHFSPQNWFAVNGGQVVHAYDQGCYDDNGVNTTRRIREIESIASCIIACRSRGHNFSGIRAGRSYRAQCFCIRVLFPAQRLRESLCHQYCSSYSCGDSTTYRVLSTDELSTDFYHRTPWLNWRSNDTENACALFYVHNGHVYLVRAKCDHRHSSICCVKKREARRGSIVLNRTWFEAQYHCRRMGGTLVSPQNNCLGRPVSSFNTLSLWTSLKSWATVVNGEAVYDNIFTNWSRGQPDFSKACIKVDHNGAWKTANCSENQNFICEADEAWSTSSVYEMPTAVPSDIPVTGDDRSSQDTSVLTTSALTLRSNTTFSAPYLSNDTSEFPTTGVAVGVSIGLIISVAVVILAVTCVRRRRKRIKDTSKNNISNPNCDTCKDQDTITSSCNQDTKTNSQISPYRPADIVVKENSIYARDSDVRADHLQPAAVYCNVALNTENTFAMNEPFGEMLVENELYDDTSDELDGDDPHCDTLVDNMLYRDPRDEDHGVTVMENELYTAHLDVSDETEAYSLAGADQHDNLDVNTGGMDEHCTYA